MFYKITAINRNNSTRDAFTARLFCTPRAKSRSSDWNNFIWKLLTIFHLWRSGQKRCLFSASHLHDSLERWPLENKEKQKTDDHVSESLAKKLVLVFKAAPRFFFSWTCKRVLHLQKLILGKQIYIELQTPTNDCM